LQPFWFALQIAAEFGDDAAHEWFCDAAVTWLRDLLRTC